MKRKTYRPYIVLFLLLLSCLSLPQASVEPFRGVAIAVSSPLWKKFFLLRSSIFPSSSFAPEEKGSLEEDSSLIRRQNEKLKKRLLSEERLEAHLKNFREIGFQTADKEFFVRRQKALKTRLNLEAHSLSAEVIYRQPSAWSSTLWVDVGEKDNEALGVCVVSVNSPVLVDSHLVGVVEFVGKRQSRVRLLTDSSLVVSVRAVRGKESSREMLRLIEEFSFQLSVNQENLLSPEDEKVLCEKLTTLKIKLEETGTQKYLAKGELFGTSSPLWRSRSPILKGIGFNYDFEDAEGPARELRTGKPYDALFHNAGVSLIREGDLLVTTGLEGIFPPDIPVAIVSEVALLKEGAASYSIEARLCSNEIEDLSAVTILPSLEVNLEEKQ